MRHVAQIEWTSNSDQTVPRIPEGKSNFGRAENRWENIISIIVNKQNVSGEMNWAGNTTKECQVFVAWQLTIRLNERRVIY